MGLSNTERQQALRAKRKEQGLVQVIAYITRNARGKLSEQAAANGITLGDYLTRLLTDAVTRNARLGHAGPPPRPEHCQTATGKGCGCSRAPRYLLHSPNGTPCWVCGTHKNVLLKSGGGWRLFDGTQRPRG